MALLFFHGSWGANLAVFFIGLGVPTLAVFSSFTSIWNLFHQTFSAHTPDWELSSSLLVNLLLTSWLTAPPPALLPKHALLAFGTDSNGFLRRTAPRHGPHDSTSHEPPPWHRQPATKADILQLLQNTNDATFSFTITDADPSNGICTVLTVKQENSFLTGGDLPDVANCSRVACCRDGVLFCSLSCAGHLSKCEACALEFKDYCVKQSFLCDAKIIV